jgi:LytS/YehU family sensor histidine kinase
LAVADTGRGFTRSLGTGAGLANIRARLAATYGDDAELAIDTNAPHGAIVTIALPHATVETAAATT